MKRPTFKAIEKQEELPILVFDKSSQLGGILARRLDSEVPCVFVGKENPSSSETQRLIFIPLVRRIPIIPQNTYSHILFFYRGGKDVLDCLDPFIKKAEADKSRFLFFVHVSDYDQAVVDTILSSYGKAHVVVYADYISDTTPFDKEYKTHRLLYQAEKNGTVSVQGDGTRPVYAVFLEDIVLGIIKVAFSNHASQRMHLLFPKHPQTEMAFVRLLQRLYPLLAVDFMPEDPRPAPHRIPVEGEFLLTDSYLLETRLKELVEKGVAKKWVLENPVIEDFTLDKRRVTKKIGLSYGIWFVLALVMVILVLPFFSTVLFLFVGMGQLASARVAVDRADIAASIKSVQRAQSSFLLARKTNALLTQELMLFGQEETAGVFTGTINNVDEISVAISSLFKAIGTLQNVFLGNNTSNNKDFLSATNDLKQAIGILQRINVQQQDMQAGLFSTLFQKEKREISKISQSTALATSLLDVLPALFGINEKKQYLLLFQNNMELRPGGGFIGSYGLATFDGGRMTDFSVHDVYDADGQLKGHVEPPFPLRRFLPQVHLYLRDSNFDIDFQKNASQAAYLLRLETGKRVDGVIGIDVSFARRILQAIGSVYVPQYDTTVTADNMYMLMQKKVEKESFAGSRQKHDFLQFLFQAMQSELLKRKDLQYLALANAITDAIAKKDILFAFADPSIQQVFSANNMSSSLTKSVTFSQGNYSDFIGLSEANLGVNKANYFVKRKVEYMVGADKQGSMSARLLLGLKNTGAPDQWPGGPYKTYVRAIVPRGSRLQSIEINGKAESLIPAVTNPVTYEAADFKPPVGVEVEQYEEGEYAVYGILIIVSPSDYASVAFNYILPQLSFAGQKTMTYNLQIFKQPGIDEFPFLFTYTFPQEYTSYKLPSAFMSSGNSISYKTIVDRDTVVQVPIVAQ